MSGRRMGGHSPWFAAQITATLAFHCHQDHCHQDQSSGRQRTYEGAGTGDSVAGGRCSFKSASRSSRTLSGVESNTR